MTNIDAQPIRHRPQSDGLRLVDWRNGYLEIDNPEGVTIAHATRYYLTTASFSGWVVASRRNRSDPVTTKSAALTVLWEVARANRSDVETYHSTPPHGVDPE
jgi:hypothetical protein